MSRSDPRPELASLAVWTYHLNYQPTPVVQATVAELEELGYGAVWIGEAVYREPFTAAAVLLSATERMTVGTGIASIWTRDPFAMAAGQLTLAEAYPDRFLLGIGVSHARLVEGLRGHRYERPLKAMREYLDRMDEAAAEYRAVRPTARPPRVLAALGPRMLELARDRADGVHTYLVPPEHTADARRLLGPGPLLIVEQAVVLSDEPSRARAVARRHVSRYLDLPNYTDNLRRLGFTDTDLSGDGSDRLIDALVAWGDLRRVADRLGEHLDAGADQICVQVFDPDPHGLPLRQWRELARAMT